MKWFPVDQDNILLSLPKVLITPHVAGATDITLQGMADDAEKVMLKRLLSILEQDKSRRGLITGGSFLG